MSLGGQTIGSHRDGVLAVYFIMAVDTRASARAFVRSLNILLKFARLYEFGHVRTAAQFETTWKELRAALDESGGNPRQRRIIVR